MSDEGGDRVGGCGGYEGEDRVGGCGGYEGLLSGRVEEKERHAETHPEEFVPLQGNTPTGFSRAVRGRGEGGSCVWKGESPSYPTYGVIGRKDPGWMDLFPLHRRPQWKSPEEERSERCRRRKVDQEELSCAPILCRRKDHSLPPKKVVTFSPSEEKGRDEGSCGGCEERRGGHPLYRTTNGEYGRLVSHSTLLGGVTRAVRGASDLPKVTRRNTALN